MKTPHEAMRIFVIGSCRVHRPVASLDSGVASYLTGGAGMYTHTLKEAIQRLELLRGNDKVPPSLARFVYASAAGPMWAPRMMDDLHSSDVLVVEVSSEKEVQVDGVYLQLNYLASALIAPLGEAGRKWWSQLLRRGIPTSDVIAEVLTSPAAVDLDEGAKLVLDGATLQRSTEISLREDIRRLVELADRPVMLVTHVDLGQLEPGVLAGRSRFVARLKRAAESIPRVSIFDPTPVIAAFGRPFALNDGGRDTNHYADMFEPILGRLLVARADSLFMTSPRGVPAEIAE